MNRVIAVAYFSRKSPRIQGYDYSVCNYYFITVCTNDKRNLFGYPNNLNELGKVVDKHIQNISRYYQNVWIDKYVVMPNHVHLILILGNEDKNPNVSLIIGQLKRGITKEIHENYPDMDVWQRSFHDHVIRNQAGYEKIWQYIENNPIKWEEDCFYIQNES